MGVVISTTALSPLSLTSTIIGLVSFAFTVATFIRVVWTSLENLTEAPHEVHSYLTTLRTELIEERVSLKLMRKQSRKFQKEVAAQWHLEESTGSLLLNEVSLKTMADTLRSLIKKFKALERPFLQDGASGIDDFKRHRPSRRNSSVSPHYEHSAYAPVRESRHHHSEKSGDKRGRSRTDPEHHDHDRDRDRDRDDAYADEAFWAQRTAYRPLSLRLRLHWLWCKGDAEALYASLTRVQIRRVARQVGGLSCFMAEAGEGILRTQAAVGRIEERMGNIVGLRRVE